MLNLFKKRFVWPLAGVQISSVFLFAIIFLLPNNAFAQNLVMGDSGTILSTSSERARDIEITYQNTSGVPLTAMITMNPGGTGCIVRAGASSVTFTSSNHLIRNDAPANGMGAVTFTVPNNWFYRLQTNCTADKLNNWKEFLPGTTTNFGTTTVSNPNQDLFNGFLMFFMVMVFVIWFFKR